MIAVNENFSVVDEGDGWILLNKSAPLIVHPANNRDREPTLLGGVEGLLAYEVANGARMSIINRLDRETSGLVMMATNKSVAREMSRAMERREVGKSYDAIVHGWPDWDEIVVKTGILRKGELEPSRIYIKQRVHSEGKHSETLFNVVQRYTVNGMRVSLLKVRPVTGRTHQIRVHASHLGYPLIGDKIYGEDEECYLKYVDNGLDDELMEKLYLPRHALHASGFSIAVDGVDREWEIALASDLREFLAGAEIEAG